MAPEILRGGTHGWTHIFSLRGGHPFFLEKIDLKRLNLESVFVGGGLKISLNGGKGALKSAPCDPVNNHVPLIPSIKLSR